MAASRSVARRDSSTPGRSPSSRTRRIALVMVYESGCGVPDHREVPDWSDGSTKARRRFQSVNVTFQARPPREMIRGPSTLRVKTRGSTAPISSRPCRTVNWGSAVNTDSTSRRWHPKRRSASDAVEEHAAVNVQVRALLQPYDGLSCLLICAERQPSEPLRPRFGAHLVLLQAQREKLLRDQVKRLLLGQHRFDGALREQPEQRAAARRHR